MTNDERPLRDMSDEELQDESVWDDENAQQLPPPERKARAIVSVAFPGEAFDYISAAARDADMKLSHFIREAAIEKATSVALTVSIDADAVRTETQGFSITTDVLEGDAILA